MNFINDIRDWAKKNSIEKQTIDGFWYALDNYFKEEKVEFYEVFGEDFSKGLLNIKMKNVSVFIDKWVEEQDYEGLSYGFDYVVTITPIVYKEKQIGVYKMLFTLDGESFDDFFIID